MVLNAINYIIIIAVFIVGYCLFGLKSEVSNLDYQLSQLTKQIREENEEIHVLQAEFSHLRSPNNLQKLVLGNLPLKTINTSQVTSNLLLDSQKTPPKNTASKLASNTKYNR